MNENEFADLTHRIEGFAHQGNTPFSVPLFSHIDGFLWMGGSPVDHAPKQFKFIVDLYTGGMLRANASEFLHEIGGVADQLKGIGDLLRNRAAPSLCQRVERWFGLPG